MKVQKASESDLTVFSKVLEIFQFYVAHVYRGLFFFDVVQK
jgi:hypothetical protein